MLTKIDETFSYISLHKIFDSLLHIGYLSRSNFPSRYRHFVPPQQENRYVYTTYQLWDSSASNGNNSMNRCGYCCRAHRNGSIGKECVCNALLILISPKVQASRSNCTATCSLQTAIKKIDKKTADTLSTV